MSRIHQISDPREIDVTKIRGYRFYSLGENNIVVMKYAHGDWGVELRADDGLIIRREVVNHRRMIIDAVKTLTAK